MGEPYRFSGAFAEVIELCTSGFSTSYGLDVYDIWRIKRENSLYAFIANNSSDRKVFIYTAAFSADYSSGEDLNTLFGAFFDLASDVDNVADLKVWHLFS